MGEVSVSGADLVIGPARYKILDSDGKLDDRTRSEFQAYLKSLLSGRAPEVLSGKLFEFDFDGGITEAYRKLMLFRNLLMLFLAAMFLLKLTNVVHFNDSLFAAPIVVIGLMQSAAVYFSPRSFLLFAKWNIRGQVLTLKGLGRSRSYEIRGILNADLDITPFRPHAILLTIVTAEKEKILTRSRKLEDLLPLYESIVRQRPDLMQ